MIHIKNEKEIVAMTTGGKILAEVLFAVMDHIKPGVSEIELDRMAEAMIREKGGEPGFQKVAGYHHTICSAINEVVVHGIPTEYVIKEGDVVCIDCGVYYGGLHTDMAETIRIKKQESGIKNKKSDDIDLFLATGKKALVEAIKVAVVGNRIGHISQVIQDIVEKQGGYSIVRSLVGHGVGKKLHEDPEVPGFVVSPLEKTPLLKEGMTIAIEIIYNMGEPDVIYANNDGWTIKTKDNSLSAVFERTVLIAKEGPVVLTA